MKKIAISDDQRKIILQILKNNFPEDKYFVFGSRATHRLLKQFSDLDIAIDSKLQIDPSDLAKAAEDFSSSNLPFKVDLVDLGALSSEFRKNIEGDFIELKA
jgi:predicted nucleotidyltransferase